MQNLFILGRQPALGIVELESLYGTERLQLVRGTSTGTPAAALLDGTGTDIDFARLGGSIKQCHVLATLDTTDWGHIETHLLAVVPEHVTDLPEGKLTLGISAYGLKATPRRLQASGLTLKKAIRKSGRPVRLVPNATTTLNSASVLHNNLTSRLGMELVCLRDGNRTIIGRTFAEQDIDSYTIRDRGRPKRDARVGMLPPKLAQIIINLANPSPGATVLDPFCGTGVLLQEALLMGFSAYGSDLEPRMIEYSRTNLEWLVSHHPWLAKNIYEHKNRHLSLHVQDATSYVVNNSEHDVSAVACETYLGRPFTSPPSPEVLTQTISECNLIIKKFLRSVAPQVAAGTMLCLAVPAWQARAGSFKHLPLLERSGSIDALTDMGYNRVSFEYARNEDLTYFRTDQIVARELLVLQKL